MEWNGHSQKSLVLFPKYLLEITKPVPGWYTHISFHFKLAYRQTGVLLQALLYQLLKLI